MGQTGYLTFSCPPRIHGDQAPPQQANTFTDASVLLPKTPWASHAGIGIVHIDRAVEKNPLHTIEDTMGSFGRRSLQPEAPAVFTLCGSEDTRRSKTRTMARYPSTTGEAMPLQMSWQHMQVRITTRAWANMRKRRSSGTTSIESWYIAYTSTCSA